MLRVEGVSVHFGGVRALRDVSVTVPSGRITGLIGPNGAGKTTLFNVVTGIQRPNQGRVYLDGHDVTRASVPKRAALGIARTFQRLELFSSLSAKENVKVALEAQRGRTSRARSDRQAQALLDRVGIGADAETLSEVLPTGKRRLVELARALACNPSVLLLDEISSGLDAYESHRLGVLLRELVAEGMAVLLVEHDMELVMGVCEEIFVLDFGEMIAAGTPEAVAGDSRVQSAYLGQDADAGPSTNGAGSASRPIGSPVSGDDRDSTADHAPTGGEPAALEISGVSAGYDRVEVLHDVSLAVAKGQVLALLGPNGAGKSTTLRAITGQLPISGGVIRALGRDLTGRSADYIARSGVCGVPEGRAVFPNLTVEENLRMWTYCGGRTAGQVIESTFERFPQLATRRRQLAGTLSGGEQQMLAMSRALSTSPQVLLVDEISMGLAPLVVAELYDAIAHVAAEGISIIVVEQFAAMALKVADRAAVLSGGRIVLEGVPEFVQEGLADVYLHRPALA